VAYPDIERGICARYGAAWQKKISVIPTGFDDDLFGQETLTAPSKFTILYPGHHFCEESRHGDSFLKAVDEWVDSDTRLKNRVDFVFIGKRDEELVRRRTAMRHSKVIRLEPLISHRACIRAIISSNVCVVNAVGNRIPVKVYECMRAGKWLLALTPPGSDLDRLVGRYSRGISVPPQDISSIRNALQALFHLRDSGEAEEIEVDSFLDQYSSRHNAARICRIFEDALDPRERRTAAASHA